MRLFSLFICFIFSSSALAHPPKAYMTTEPGFFSGPPKVTVNGIDVAPQGWAGGFYLEEVMKSNPLAVEYAQKHVEYSKWANIALWGGLGGAIGYLVASRPNTNFGVYWGIFATGLITAAGLGKASQSYLLKSINTYNGVDTNKTSQLDFSIMPIQNGGTFAFSYSF